MVTTVESDGSRLEITLTDNADTQDLLKALIDRVAVHKFEIKVPSLHEIFVSLVGSSNEQDS